MSAITEGRMVVLRLVVGLFSGLNVVIVITLTSLPIIYILLQSRPPLVDQAVPAIVDLW